MFREGIPSKQLSAWLAAAMIPVLIQTLSGMSWLMVLMFGTLSVVVGRWIWGVGSIDVPRWVSIAQFLFLILLLGQLLEGAAKTWQSENGWAVPLIMLVLAAWSAQKGPSAAARVGCVLFWFVLVIYLIVLGAGVKDVHLLWLKPSGTKVEWLGMVVLLLPCAASVLLKSGEKWGVRLVLPMAFAVTATMVTVGVLSASVASSIWDPFYEMSRSLSLLGVAKRFEAVVSAGMTVGWFALISLLLTVSGKYFEKIVEGKGRLGIWVCGVVSVIWLLCGLHIPQWITGILAAVFWVGIPVLTQGIETQKKS